MADSKNTLSSTQYLKIIDLISEGEIKGLVNGFNSIFIDGVPLQASTGEDNFTGFDIETRNGTPDQLPLERFNFVEREIRVGVQLKKSIGLSAREIVTRAITSDNVNAVRFKP